MALWQQANVLLKTLDTTATAAPLGELQGLLAAAPATGFPPAQALPGRLALLQGELALVQHHAAEAAAALARADALIDPVQDPELAARAAQGLGATARLAGDVAAARRQLQRSANLHAGRGEGAVVDRLNVALDLGGLENAAGEHAAAAQLLAPVHADLLARLGPQHPMTVAAVSELALATLRLGRQAELATWLAALRNGSGPDDAWRIDHADTLAAMAQLAAGQADAAEPALRRLLAALLRDEGGVSAATEPVRRLHAEALLRLGRLPEAEAELRSTLANQQALVPAAATGGHPSTATTRVLLGVALARRGDLPAARQHWAEAAPALAKALGPAHPHAVVAACYAALAAAPGSPQAADRSALAAQLQQRLGWQQGSAALLAMLRAPGSPPDWRQLPVVL